MSLEDLAAKGLIDRQPPSPAEIADLIVMAARDLENAKLEGLDADWQFAIAYQAMLHLAAVVLRAEGWRAAGRAHHYATLVAFGLIARDELGRNMGYFQSCRTKRNKICYDRAGETTEAEAMSLLQAVADLRNWTLQWLADNHPELLPEKSL